MFQDLDDPKKQALLALAAGLFSPVRGKGWSGFGEAMGQGINAGLLGLNQATRTQEAVKRGEMERKLEQARLAQIEQARKAQEYMGQGIGKFMSPGVRPATPNDDNGNPMPSSPAGFDQSGFAQYLAQNPATAREALNFIPKPEAQLRPMVVGKSLVDPKTGKPIYTEPEPPKEAKPNFKDYPRKNGILRVFDDGTSKVIYKDPDEATSPAAPKPTPAQGAVDKAYAKDYLEWTQGGFSDAAKSIKQLREVSKKLGASGAITGGVVGNIPHSIRSSLGMDSADVQDQVEEIVQRNLRLILGAQFTEKEGARLIARAYNPRLDEKENKARVDRLSKQIEQAAQAKQSQAEYYEKNGTLNGWTGKIWTMDDFDPEGIDERKAAGKVGAPKPGTVMDGYLFKGGDPADRKNWVKR